VTGRRVAAWCWHATVTICLCAMVAVGAMVAVTVLVPHA